MMDESDLDAAQLAAIQELTAKDRAILRALMGAGKTVITGTVLVNKISVGDVRRAVLFAPLRVANSVWPGELSAWRHLSGIRYQVATGDARQRKQAIEDVQAHLVITNHENLDWLFKTYGDDHGFDTLIIDELTKIKTPTGKRWQALADHLWPFATRYGLTGTYVANDLRDIFGQTYLIDDGERLGANYERFMRTWFHAPAPDTGNWTSKPKKDAAAQVGSKVASLITSVRRDDYDQHLPEIRNINLATKMPADARDLYETIEEDGELDPAQRALKLRQLVQGFEYTEESDERFNPKIVQRGVRWYHAAKVKMFRDFISKAPEPLCPMLVVYKYRADIDALLQVLPSDRTFAHLGPLNDSKDDDVIDAWNNRQIEFLFLHPLSASHGLNLQHGSNVIYHHAYSDSLDDYDQLIARLRRRGQANPVVFNILPRVLDTVDEDILAAYGRKTSVRDAVLNGIERRSAQRRKGTR